MYDSFDINLIWKLKGKYIVWGEFQKSRAKTERLITFSTLNWAKKQFKIIQSTNYISL